MIGLANLFAYATQWNQRWLVSLLYHTIRSVIYIFPFFQWKQAYFHSKEKLIAIPPSTSCHDDLGPNLTNNSTIYGSIYLLFYPQIAPSGRRFLTNFSQRQHEKTTNKTKNKGMKRRRRSLLNWTATATTTSLVYQHFIHSGVSSIDIFSVNCIHSG